jgi:preprotein translocase subunit SecD
VTGRDLRDAQPQQGDAGRWETSFVLSQEAAKKFETFTAANVGNRLAIVLDHRVLSAPTIQNKISDTGRITGAASHEETEDLALNLRSGTLPAAEYLGRTHGGSSGRRATIRFAPALWPGIAGVIAGVRGMLEYYKKAGVNATLALVLNAVILIAALSYFEAVLTLPGIAGVILTIGMAVDSNVLIFERIREELRAGKAVIAAVDAGFAKAFLTIIDTHVTT